VIEGVDYSVGRPDPACLVANGKHFACRYVSSPGGIDKDLSPDEARRLTAAGVAICTNFEDWEEKPLKGFDVGAADATLAWEHAAVCGMPVGRPIYFSVDFDASSTQLAGPITEYFRGCASVLGVERVGGYGGLRTIRFLFDNNLIRWGWQTYAWSGGVWDSRAQVQQYKNATTVCGVSLDLDRAVVDDYGQWFAFKEDDLASADEILAAVAALDSEVASLADRVAKFEGKFDTFRQNERQRDAQEMERIAGLGDQREMARALRAMANSIGSKPKPPASG